MKLDDVAARLQRCGLSDKEARAFVHLTNLGRSKVTDLAKAAGLKRAETYQVLERLQGRGLVEATLERPRTYAAVAPSRAVEVLVEEREAELRAVAAMRDDVRERLEALGAAHPEPAGSTFRVLHDHNQITGQLKRTLRAAKREVGIVASGRSLFLLLLDEGLEAEVRAARAAGVRVRILTEVLPGQEEDVERLGQLAEVRHMMVPRPLRLVVADESEIVQYVTADALTGGAKETALWIGARDHVQAQRAFFDDLWNEAVPGEDRLVELRTGRPPPRVQVVRGRLTRTEKAKEMILRARREIALLARAAEAARLAKSGLSRALAARSRDGVRVRLLVPRETGAPAVAGAEVRQADVGHEMPVLLVDDAEALLVLGGEEDAEKVTALQEYAVYATLAPTVAALQARFDAAWARGKRL